MNVNCSDPELREQNVIAARFGLQHKRQTLRELGDQLRVSCERVRKIEARAVNKLRLAARKERVELPN